MNIPENRSGSARFVRASGGGAAASGGDRLHTVCHLVRHSSYGTTGSSIADGPEMVTSHASG